MFNICKTKHIYVNFNFIKKVITPKSDPKNTENNIRYVQTLNQIS